MIPAPYLLLAAAVAVTGAYGLGRWHQYQHDQEVQHGVELQRQAAEAASQLAAAAKSERIVARYVDRAAQVDAQLAAVRRRLAAAGCAPGRMRGAASGDLPLPGATRTADAGATPAATPGGPGPAAEPEDPVADTVAAGALNTEQLRALQEWVRANTTPPPEPPP